MGFLPRPLRPAGTARDLGEFGCSDLNLPGWRWGTIMQIPLVAVSRPLHSGVCETRQDAGLPVLHSKISDSGLLRTRGGQQMRSRRSCAVRGVPGGCRALLGRVQRSGNVGSAPGTSVASSRVPFAHFPSI